MHYYIDGYNLMFRVLRAGDELQKQREKIIHDLHSKIKLLGIDATLIFDAYYQKGVETRTHRDPIEILFTKEKQTADELILEKLKESSNLRLETVVTSDKKLAWYVRRKGAQCQTVEEFFSLLNRRVRNKVKAPIAPTVQPKVLLPKVKKSAEEKLLDYYLDKFGHEEPSHEEPLKEVKLQKLEKQEDDFERWLRIFGA